MSWSSDLITRTRQALTTFCLLPTPEGCIGFKHWDGRFATMAEIDLIAGRLLLRNRNGGADITFASVDDLIAADWVID